MFEVGDKVSWCGVEGEVTSVDATGIGAHPRYPLEVQFRANREHFTPDGRFASWHTEPSLKLTSRPKKKVKVYRHYFIDSGYKSNFINNSSPTLFAWEEYSRREGAGYILLYTEELFECDDPRGGE